MKYNILYGILLAGAQPATSDMCYKKYTPVILTDRGREIVSKLVPGDVSRRPLFACTVCAYATDTCFGRQILELDGNNTYNKPVRTAQCKIDVTSEEAGSCLMYGLTCRAASMTWLRPLLDADIVERLVDPQWIEMAAAACLQLLREAY